MDTWHTLEQRFLAIANNDFNVVVDVAAADERGSVFYSLSGPVAKGKGRISLIGGQAAQPDFSTDHYAVREVLQLISRAATLLDPELPKARAARKFMGLAAEAFGTDREGRTLIIDGARACAFVCGELSVAPAMLGLFRPAWLRHLFEKDDFRTVKTDLGDRIRKENDKAYWVEEAVLPGGWLESLRKEFPKVEAKLANIGPKPTH